MTFSRGMKVKHRGHFVGFVAGEFNPMVYPGGITVILTPEYLTKNCDAWLWDDWGKDHGCIELQEFCKNKYCFNFPSSELESCLTKLGNEL